MKKNMETLKECLLNELDGVLSPGEIKKDGLFITHLAKVLNEKGFVKFDQPRKLYFPEVVEEEDFEMADLFVKFQQKLAKRYQDGDQNVCLFQEVFDETNSD